MLSVSNSVSIWWKDLFSVCFENGNGCWFDEAVSRKIGNGSDFSFWDEDWSGGGIFSNRFPRLYAISSQQTATVAQMGDWIGEGWRWRFEWRRQLLEREKARVEELKNNIAMFSPRLGQRDRK